MTKSYFGIAHHKVTSSLLKLLCCDEVFRTMLVCDKKKIYRIVLKHIHDQMIHHYKMMTFIEWRSLCEI